ncbi:RIP metalloprotease RseP [Hoeflea sp. CAU 1731]
MDVLENIYSIVVGTVLPFIIVLTIVVFVHEMGHYLVGRWCGIRIVTFSIGFGRELAGFTDRNGTRWKLSAIPLGGYVKFFGDENAASFPDEDKIAEMSLAEQSQTFQGASLGRRAATVAAGPIANFILAIVIFTAVYSYFGKAVLDPVVASVQPASSAAEAGLEPGDRILEIDGKTIDSFDDLRIYVSTRPGVELRLIVERGGRNKEFMLVPKRAEVDNGFGDMIEVGQIGVVASANEDTFRYEKMGPLEALTEGVGQSFFIISQTVQYFKNIIIGRARPDQISGPIGIAKISGQVVSVGLVSTISFIAFISVSIGFLNLLPIPILDGGHLLFYLIEFLRGKPVGEKGQEFAFKIGLSLLLMLMIYATWNDVT